MPETERICRVLQAVRAPFQTDEYELHRLLTEHLEAEGLAVRHEVPLAPRCRIDLMCGNVGIEIKKGKPDRARLIAQLTRYAASPEVAALIAVTERSVDLPASVGGKPLCGLCLNRLWGIAL